MYMDMLYLITLIIQMGLQQITNTFSFVMTCLI